ncbi:hypothetical protein CONPUDRAFT_75396 [Coniophora puteana RWD-64-598 SS2]|uniref:Uncharacterized protein n=1 Tax=Coniophora puteana (strain RWD-64-598) TaxID=741705 RepID=A0A5M3MEF5_CONPW|nr:uncharacterized protein CONPUDRAFT_75396 [Coniophora puteana RWD-64-598 SS2]EIW77533.1 hypothetical protein CONPUDRAFT_75396 [Coniophora puteana RWD-64-598 SS2]
MLVQSLITERAEVFVYDPQILCKKQIIGCICTSPATPKQEYKPVWFDVLTSIRARLVTYLPLASSGQDKLFKEHQTVRMEHGGLQCASESEGGQGNMIWLFGESDLVRVGNTSRAVRHALFLSEEDTSIPAFDGDYHHPSRLPTDLRPDSTIQTWHPMCRASTTYMTNKLKDAEKRVDEINEIASRCDDKLKFQAHNIRKLVSQGAGHTAALATWDGALKQVEYQVDSVRQALSSNAEKQTASSKDIELRLADIVERQSVDSGAKDGRLAQAEAALTCLKKEQAGLRSQFNTLSNTLQHVENCLHSLKEQMCTASTLEETMTDLQSKFSSFTIEVDELRELIAEVTLNVHQPSTLDSELETSKSRQGSTGGPSTVRTEDSTISPLLRVRFSSGQIVATWITAPFRREGVAEDRTALSFFGWWSKYKNQDLQEWILILKNTVPLPANVKFKTMSAAGVWCLAGVALALSWVMIIRLSAGEPVKMQSERLSRANDIHAKAITSLAEYKAERLLSFDPTAIQCTHRKEYRGLTEYNFC